MKNIIALCGLLGFVLCAHDALGVGVVGGVSNSGDANTSRGSSLITSPNTGSNGVRGNQAIASAYKQAQLRNFYITTQVDVESACTEKFMKCLTEFCGGTVVTAGVVQNRCQYVDQNDLYNYALLCVQSDTTRLLPQYDVNSARSSGPMNTAAQLCPPYASSSVMTYLSMANMADQLSKASSNLCIQRRQELQAAMSCHSAALTYGNETTSKLVSHLTDYCGSGVPGGSAEMVSRFANAGNIGANVWGWAEKIVSLDVNSKGADWQAAMDNVLVGYTNRMNLACGDNLQVNTGTQTVSTTGTTALLTAAALVGNTVGNSGNAGAQYNNPNAYQSLWMDVLSNYNILDSNTATQVVNAALVNTALTSNPFLTSAQMTQMQDAYKRGTKVFIIRDGVRCFIVPVQTLTDSETSMVATQFSTCRK